MKKIIAVFLSLIMVFSLTACGNRDIKKSIEAGKSAMDQKNYEEALNFYKTAIDKGVKDEEVNSLYNIISSYLKAEKFYKDGEYKGAIKVIDGIDEKYKQYSIKEDIDYLRAAINEKIDYNDKNEEMLSKIQKSISKENYEEALNIISSLEKRTVTEEQKNQLEELKNRAEKLLKEKNEEQTEHGIVENPSDTPAGSDNGGTGLPSSGEVTKDRAVELVKQYLESTGQYIPQHINVDSEDSVNFNVQAFDIVDNGNGDSHTATSGWYYVNKSTGEVTSMF